MIRKAPANRGAFYTGLESVPSVQSLCVLLLLLLRVHHTIITGIEKNANKFSGPGESLLWLATHIWTQMFIGKAEISPSCTLFLHLFSSLQEIRANTDRYSRLHDFLTHNTTPQLHTLKQYWRY